MNLPLFSVRFLPITALDLLDLLAVAFVFYQVLMLVKGTRAAQMIVGLMVLVIASFAAQGLQMRGLSWLLSRLQTVLAFGLIIIFQPELRRILIRMGQSPIIRFFYRGGWSRPLDEVTAATETLAERGYGALIVLVREVGIGAIVETGVRLNAEVSADLLVSIFTPRAPLHDMAVVVQGDLILAAKCVLPLTQNPDVAPMMGTRHRAALGLSEESDAVVVVVSEETQTLSIAVDGRMIRNLAPSQLRAELAGLFGKR